MQKGFRLFNDWIYYTQTTNHDRKELGKEFAKIVNPDDKPGNSLGYRKIADELAKTGTTPDGGRITCGGLFMLKDIEIEEKK